MSAELSSTPIQYIKGVGPKRAILLANLGISTVEDLLYLFPYRYEDRRHFQPINKIVPGGWCLIKGEVLVGGLRRSYSAKQIVEVAIGDASGRLTVVWFNQPYLANYFKPGVQVVCFGKVDVFRNRLQMIAPDYEIIDSDDNSLHMGRIVPIYPLTKGIGQKYLRQIIHTCLMEYGKSLHDIIPASIRKRHGFSSINESIQHIHFPLSLDEQHQSNERVSFEEFFLFQISVLLRRMSLIEKKGVTHRIDNALIGKVSESLNFTLTAAQTRCINEIISDMRLARPMLRLLQGDVGSGKTVVAFMAAIAACEAGYQVAVMAPTEILALQHARNFERLFSKGKFSNIKSTLLISSSPKKEKDQILAELKSGKINIVFGTHALLEPNVVFKNLSLVVIDEQHKFGVNQRALLTNKAINPDVLIMTATPIPRTLCLTLYGDVDVSVIDQMPPGRGVIKTYHFSSTKAPSVYQKIRELVKQGTQAYVIYPLVEESEKLDLKAAVAMFEQLKHQEFKGLRLGLVHGQMKKKDTDVLMEAFKKGELDILVATTILEVGIDVSNANVMLIEHAERFGLSQLHQLRGRIGRGKHNAVCILLGDPTTDEGRARLEAIVKTTNGFKIAEYDLEIRGPGHYFGRHQHGVNELRVANPLTQVKLLEKARQEAIDLFKHDQHLVKQEHQIIKKTIQRRYPQYLELVLAG